MAETLTRRSPLQGWFAQFAATAPATILTEEPFVTMVDLWVDPDGAGGAEAASLLGLAALPTTPGTCVAGPDTTVIWFGPQEWLITSTQRGGEALEAQLHAAVAAAGGAAVDVSAQRTTIRLRGAHARDVLAKGCSLDLHPRVFGPCAAVQTMLALAAVVLIPLDDKGTDYRLIVRSSFAGYLADWLIDAVAEYL